jgi:ABC-type uncharacterized transport system permease subunit
MQELPSSAATGLRGRVETLVSLALHVRVPTQHGIFALAVMGGALLGTLLGGRGRLEMSDVVPPWLPASLSSALVVGAVVGAALAGLAAWLVCRPRRAQRWTIEYPQSRMVSIRGVSD